MINHTNQQSRKVIHLWKHISKKSLRQSPYFAPYTLEGLKMDLTSLVKWGNLHAQQESGRVRSIEEFNNKRFRYQITPYTVEFERMLLRFEQNSETFLNDDFQLIILKKCLHFLHIHAII